MKSKPKYRSTTYFVFNLELSPCPGCRTSVWDQIFFFKRMVFEMKHIYIFGFLLTTGHKVSVLTCILEEEKRN